MNSELSAETMVVGFPVVTGSGEVMCLWTQPEEDLQLHNF